MMNRNLIKKAMNAVYHKNPNWTALDIWRYKTDFEEESFIGYICDDGRIAIGFILRTKEYKILVDFNINPDSEHATYGGIAGHWISVPNDRIVKVRRDK